MCAKFSIKRTHEEIVKKYGIKYDNNLNLTSGTKEAGSRIPVILKDGNEIKLTGGIWGFEESFSQFKYLLNARTETWKSKSLFKNCKPCLIPLTTFFETGVEFDGNGNRKETEEVPEIFYIKGLWKMVDGIPRIVTLTQPAWGDVLKVHERAPVIETNPDEWIKAA